MKCKDCKGEDWELIWFRALIEEDKPLNMYQCRNCKRIVMASSDWHDSDNLV